MKDTAVFRYRADGTPIPLKHLCTVCRLRWKQSYGATCGWCIRAAAAKAKRAQQHAHPVQYSIHLPPTGSIARSLVYRVIGKQ